MRKALAGLAAFVVVLAGCSGGGGGGGGGSGSGGGGGGSDTPLSYVGSEGPAVIAASNASSITANFIFGGDIAQAVSSVAPATAEAGGMVNMGWQLHRSVRTGVAQLRRGNSGTPATSAIAVDETDPCDRGGSVRIFGNLNDNGTGTVSIQFNACQNGETAVSGSGTLSIAVFDPGFGPTDFTVSFTRLTFSGSTTGALSGSLRTRIDIAARKEILTENGVVLFANGTMGKSVNLELTNVYDNIFFPNSYVESVSGRVFHSVHGFVVVSTPVDLRFNTLTQEFPNNGVLVLTGAGGAAIQVTALSPTQLNLALDVDGNGTFEMAVMLAWTDLTGPVGADLGDDDGDGMHNGWEVANGFNPKNAADALGDADGDGATNVAEYRAGTNPRDASSMPPGVGLSISATDAPDPAFVGGPLTYTLTVSNFSGLAANNVMVVDTLPASVHLGSASASQGSCSGAAPVTCTLGTVSGFSIATVTIVVSPTAQGILSNTATVSTSSFDAITIDNTVTSVTTAGVPSAGIQGLIDVASPGDTIVVEPGIYTGSLNFGGKDIVLRSRDGPATTIIHGSGAFDGAVIHMGPGGTVTGFTITGGTASFGAGITLLGSTGSVISANIFEGNTQGGGGFGAAIGGNGASATIERNIFRNNSCDNQFLSGVVAFVNGSSPRIINNVFVNNTCRGINLTLPEGNTPVVINNTFVGNSTGIRVDARVSQVSQIYRNNILVQNGIGFEMEFGSPAGTPVWTNNLVSGNGVNYLGSGTENLNGNNGNISADDPLFVNQAAGNYDLQAGSPAIDAGSPLGAPAVDFDGAPRVRVVDIGAFEGP